MCLRGSVALLADTIHNFGDAATAIPLGIAFWFARKNPSGRFTFGYGRVEDLAGLTIVVTILASAIIAGFQRLLHLGVGSRRRDHRHSPKSHLWFKRRLIARCGPLHRCVVAYYKVDLVLVGGR